MVAKANRNNLENIWHALGDLSLSLKTVFLDFLWGKGVPCPQLFSIVSVHFPDVVDLSHVGEDGFCAKYFCWATTGTYEQELGAPLIQVNLLNLHICCYSSFFQVWFVNHKDISYAPASIAQVMASEGKISYGTCFQITMLPITYILKLTRAHYPNPSGELGALLRWSITGFCARFWMPSALIPLFRNILALRLYFPHTYLFPL